MYLMKEYKNIKNCYNMETKTLKIEAPKGYEIDKEKSTYENIVFKKVDDIVIKWNRNYNGVEIKADDEHFILEGNPNYSMNWNDAMRFYSNLQFWKLPTTKQLLIIYKYFNKINEVIEENGGFKLIYTSYWSIEKKDEFNARYVHMTFGCADTNFMNFNYDVRAVSTL